MLLTVNVKWKKNLIIKPANDISKALLHNNQVSIMDSSNF